MKITENYLKMVAAIQAKQEKIALYSLVFLDCRCKLYGYLTNTVTCTTDWSEKTWRTNVIQVDVSYCVNARTVFAASGLRLDVPYTTVFVKRNAIQLDET